MSNIKVKSIGLNKGELRMLNEIRDQTKLRNSSIFKMGLKYIYRALEEVDPNMPEELKADRLENILNYKFNRMI